MLKFEAIRIWSICALVVCAAGPAAAQANKDYLRQDEIEQLRNIQEPNERIELYLHFAAERVDELTQLFSKEKPGRSAFVHDLLDQYTHIIDAIGTVGDDALHRHIAIDKGNTLAYNKEKEMMGQLKQILNSKPKDLDRYEFALKDAIDATSEGVDLADEGTGQRAAEIAAKDAKDKAEHDAALMPADAASRKQAEQKAAEAQKKKPSLLRKGEDPNGEYASPAKH